MKKRKKILIGISLFLVFYVFRKTIGKGVIILFWSFLELFSYNSGKLGKGYFLIDDFKVLDEGWPYGSYIYKVVKKGKYKYNKMIIGADILKCEKENSYILVKQKFNDSLVKKRLFDKIESGINYARDSVVLFNGKVFYKKDLHKFVGYDTIILKRDSKRLSYLADSIVHNDSFYQKRMVNSYNYYVIDLKTEKLLGPLSYKLFREQMKDLGLLNLNNW